MTVVGSGEYIFTMVAEGAPQFVAAVDQVKKAQQGVNSEINRAAPASMPNPTIPYAGVRIYPSDPGPVDEAAGVAAAAARLSGATGKGPRMSTKAAAQEVGRQQSKLRSVQEQMVKDTVLGNITYDPAFQQQVMRQQAESRSLGDAAKVSLTPKGGFVQGTVANPIRDMGKEVDKTVKQFQTLHNSAVLGNQVAKKVTDEETRAANEAKRRVNESKRAQKESGMGRFARGATWILPQPAYYAMSAMETMGMPVAAMATVAAGVATVATIAMIVSAVAQYQKQIGGVAAMTGGTGLAPTAIDRQTQNQLVLAAAHMQISAPDALAMAGQFGQFGISNANSVVGGMQIASQMSVTTGMSTTDSAKAVAQLMADTGLSAKQLQQRIDDFNASVQKTGGNVQIATNDLLTFAPLLGKSGDFSGIAGLQAYAGTQGLTATQLAGPYLTSSGSARIQQAAMLGMTPDQMMALQQSPAGASVLTGDISKKLNQWVSQSGFTIAETMAESAGYLQAGPDADRTMRALLAGGSPAAQALMASGIGVTAPAPGTPGSAEALAVARAQATAGFGQQVGVYRGLIGQAIGQAALDPGNTGPGGIATPGSLFSTLGYFVSDIANAAKTSQVAGAGVAQTAGTNPYSINLDITMHDQNGNVGQATVPVTPGTTTSTPNVGVVRDGSPQGGGTNLALTGPGARIPGTR